MGKAVKTAYGKSGRKGPAKGTSHGSYRAKRKPNSPLVRNKESAKKAAQFGKDPAFREAVYGIVEEKVDE